MIFRRRTRGPAAPPPLPVPPFAPDPQPDPQPDRSEAAGTPAARPEPAEVLADLGIDAQELTYLGESAPDTPIWRLPVGASAAAVWERLRDAHPRTGWWPVLVRDDTVETTAFGLDLPGSAPDAGDGSAWLTSALDRLGVDVPRSDEPVDVPPRDDWFEWDDALDAMSFDLTTVWLVPAAADWQVPGLLGWTGAVNADLDGDDHATVLRRWSGAWGTELVGLGLDIAVLRVARPPATAAHALGAAVEAMLYCNDAVFQGTGDVDRLAAALVEPLWSFWWD